MFGRRPIKLEQKISAENAAELARYIMTEYYKLNTEPFFSVLSKNCVWILPGGPVVIGAEAIRALFEDGFVMPPFYTEDVEFDLLNTGCEEQIGVFGTYSLFSDMESEMVLAVKQRVTMLFRKEKDDFRLYHLHVSNEWTELAEDEVFPMQISSQTYHYVQKLLQERGQTQSHRIVIKVENATYAFDPDRVLYVEAADKACTIHMMNRTMVIRQPIAVLEAQFPKQFCRIHRSYLVNCRFIVKVERYAVTLVNSTALPIPAKRYMEVREKITALLK